MMRPGRTAAVVPIIAALSGVTALFARDARGAEPVTAECIKTYEDFVPLRKNHQLKAARAKVLLCSSEACPADIRTECLNRLAEIDASMPTVVFEAKDAAGAMVFAVKVKMDGDLLTERLQGSALPIDPGEHTFTFEVAGRQSVEKHLMIFEGDKLRRERVEFEALATPKSGAPPAGALLKSEPIEPPPPAAKAPSGKGRIAALALGGVGVVATGVGVAYSFVAMSRRDHASSICPNDCAGTSGVNAWDDAHSAGNIATGGFIVGAATIASGVAVWLLAKPAAERAPASQISLGPGGIQVAGRW
jgi:hypothetical protein